jgi:hypothetical protein
MVQVSRHPSSIKFYGKKMKVNLSLDLNVRILNHCASILVMIHDLEFEWLFINVKFEV